VVERAILAAEASSKTRTPARLSHILRQAAAIRWKTFSKVVETAIIKFQLS